MANFNKTIGYILIALGLVLIVWTLWHSYNIFTAKIEAPLVFQTPASLGSFGEGSLQDQINQAMQKQFNQVLPVASVTKILNLSAWSIFAFILIWAGGIVSGIGVKLIKSRA